MCKHIGKAEPRALVSHVIEFGNMYCYDDNKKYLFIICRQKYFVNIGLDILSQ